MHFSRWVISSEGANPGPLMPLRNCKPVCGASGSTGLCPTAPLPAPCHGLTAQVAASEVASPSVSGAGQDKARLVWGCSQLPGLSRFLVNVDSDVLSAPWRPEEVVSSHVEEQFPCHRPLASQCPVFPSRSQSHIIARCP